MIGVNFRPSGNVLIVPLQTRDPEPHELEAAAESVTAELRELMSRKPRTASFLFSRDAQCVPRPRTWRLNLSARGMTPALIPSETRKRTDRGGFRGEAHSGVEAAPKSARRVGPGIACILIVDSHFLHPALADE